MFDFLLPGLIIIGTTFTGCAILFALRDWADEKTKALEAWKAYAFKVEEVAAQLDKDNDALRADVRSALARELAWMSERKLLNNRNMLMARELSSDDPNKLTTLFNPGLKDN